MTKVLREDQVRSAVEYDQTAADCIRQAYLWMRDRTVSMPPVFHIDIDPNSAIDVKGAYVEGLPSFAIKMASGFNENPKRGLPSSSSVILLISAKTGFCEAVFLDNGYLMNLRTALAGAVATHSMARCDALTVGIVGTGVQARAQLEALSVLRDIGEVMVWGRNTARAEACAAEMKEVTEVEVTAVSELEALVRKSEIITTTTPSMVPLIRSDWVQPGTHITAMGSDLPGKQELQADVLLAA
ncbi:MAG: ornithine cyclodeaminase family protein, partial [Paracoccaceae bacterium]